KEGTDLGKEAKGYMDKGQLVPDDLTVRILLDRVSKDDCSKGYVLDGFPRTIPQAEVLDTEVARLGESIDFAIDVDVPDENIIRRMSGRRACLKCGATYHIEHIPPKKEGICDACGSELVLRDDDKPETVKKRLEVYHTQTQPLIDYYSKQNILRTVDGTRDMQEVFADIVKLLEA
nr:adenylate kinase [Lachnospiraceae bacterium]